MVNFYKKTPSAIQIASDLGNDELVVFNHGTSGARDLAKQVEAIVDFDFHMHNENTILKWEGADYFVMVRSGFCYISKREKLRAIAVVWVDEGDPDQIAHI